MLQSTIRICCRQTTAFTILNRTHSHGVDAVRVRFAPSPTGFLHLGGLRTALYNYLFAKLHKGKFILRIEDTDQTRLVPGAKEQLEQDLLWSGIEIDEGPSQGGAYGPYQQSHRLDIYKSHVDKLVINGSAYHCFCTDKRLQLLRREAVKAQEIPKYDNKCRQLSRDEVKARLSKGETSCIRFTLSQDEETFHDLVYGNISYNVSLSEGDPVIMKSDGFPTYHFANVVDDHLMNISHVLRGVEWQISTTKHILLYRAFNWQPPVFGHLPLLMNADGTKLSKRQGDIKISHYKNTHIFPLALLNFIVHSGGGFDKDLEQNVRPSCFTISELANQFNITRLNTNSGKLMPERLLEFNRLELKRKLRDKSEMESLVLQVKQLVQTAFSNKEMSLQLDSDYIKYILRWSSNRIHKLSDLVSKDYQFIWTVPTDYKITSTDLDAVKKLKTVFEGTENTDLNAFLRGFAQDNKLQFGSFMKMLRRILSGLQEGPSVAEIIEILGKENTVNRLKLCLDKTDKHLR